MKGRKVQGRKTQGIKVQGRMIVVAMLLLGLAVRKWMVLPDWRYAGKADQRVTGLPFQA